jgi:fructokinase
MLRLCRCIQELRAVSQRQRQFCLVGLGEILWDLLPAGPQLGGAPANFAYHAAALGGRGAVASCVGDDDRGREILERLDGLGVDRAAVALDSEHPTGTVTVEVDADGRPHYTIHENVAWDFIRPDEALWHLAVTADAVCFGTLAQRSAVSRATIAQFLEHTLAGCLRIFDINLRQSYYDRAVLEHSLEHADVVKLNDEELPVVSRLLDLPGPADEALSALLKNHSLRLVVLTKGAAGSVLISPQGTSSLPGESVKVVDTVGAGDAFTAAVALGLLEGASLEAVHRRAARLAAFVCSQSGATPHVPGELRRL